MIWDDATTTLAEPLERFDRLYGLTVLRHGGRAVDLAFANPRVPRDPRGRTVLQEVVGEVTPDDLQYRPYGGGTVQRRQVAVGLARRSGVGYRAGDVFLTPGGSAALHVAVDVAFRPGDEVILPVPSWLDHPLYLRRHGLRAVTVPLLPDSKRLDLAAVAAALTPRTAGVLLSHPACPTGVVYRRHELEALAGLLASPTDDGRPRVLLSDEVHGEHVWGADDDAPDGGFTSAAAVHPHTISTYSFGKAWVMQGQRAGFVAVSPHMADHDAVAQRVVRSLRSTGVYAPTSVMQLVAARLARLTPDNRALAADQRHVRSALGALGYRVVPAEATAFVYVRCPDGWGGDDVAFVERLAEHGLLVMPSTLFHEPGHVRLVLNVGRSELDEALTILAKEA